MKFISFTLFDTFQTRNWIGGLSNTPKIFISKFLVLISELIYYALNNKLIYEVTPEGSLSEHSTFSIKYNQSAINDGHIIWRLFG